MFFNKFFGENRIIFYFTASYGLGNALIELAVINYLYPKSRIYMFSSNKDTINELYDLKQNIHFTIYPWNKKFRVLIYFLKKILFKLTQLRLISRITETSNKKNHKFIKVIKGFFLNISLVDYSSHFQISKYLNDIHLPVNLNNYDSKLDQLVKENKDLKKLNWEKTCFIHIRRGDYIYFPDKENPAILELEWYLKAIKNIKDHVEVDKFLILSDDKYYAKDIFSNYEEMVIYSNNILSDFLLMTKCKYGILSPSTFSWCAAKLSKQRFKKENYFIAPKYWIGHRTKTWIPSSFRFKWINYI